MQLLTVVSLFVGCSIVSGTTALYQPRCGQTSLIRRHRIVGGTPATYMEFPWIVSIKGKFGCGGAIITSNFVLTASHCFFYSNATKLPMWEIRRIVIAAGAQEREIAREFTVYRRIKKLITHAKYKKGGNHLYDIALIKLNKPFNLVGKSKLRPICLPKPNEEFKGMAIVAGWGHMKRKGKESVVLLKVVMPIAGNHKCQKYFETKIYDSMICVLDPTNLKGTCNGDSGGPLVCEKNGRMYVCGVLSFGHILCQGKDIFTKVSRYLDWIERHAK